MVGDEGRDQAGDGGRGAGEHWGINAGIEEGPLLLLGGGHGVRWEGW